jgi:glycerol-3-phosphate dehydrogenase (NAD(P)+)
MQLLRSGTPAVLWGRDRAHVAAMQESRCNQRYLPEVTFPRGLALEASLEEAVRTSDEILVAVPSEAFSAIVKQIEPWLESGRGVAWACKGLEPGSGRFLHDAARELLGAERPLAVVTGPSFASEVAANMPTAVTVACTEGRFCARIATALHGGNFRAYTSDDIAGAELGGAVKNVLAVATGIGDGMGLGNNARAALITRGLAEMMRLGRALGVRKQTMMGLTGMGDLVLTCTGDLSRNRRLGLALGAGKSVDEALSDIGQVVEGVGTAQEVWRLAQEYTLEMPISEEVYGIVHKGWNPYEGVRRLLSRDQKPERR